MSEQQGVTEELRRSLFSTVPDDIVSHTAGSCHLLQFPSGTHVIEEGQKPGFVYIVVSGLVETTTHIDDRDAVLELIRPGGVCGLTAAVLGAPVACTYVTTIDSRLLMLPADWLVETARSCAPLAMAIARELSRSHHGLERQLLGQKMLTAGERLALWILGEHRRAGSDGALETPLTRSRLAAYLGTSEDNFSRLLRGVKAAGVTVGTRTLTVSDVAALTRMAGPPDLVAAAIEVP